MHWDVLLLVTLEMCKPALVPEPPVSELKARLERPVPDGLKKCIMPPAHRPW